MNNLLDVSRIEEEKFGFQFKNQTLAPIIKKIFEKFHKEAEEKGIKFSFMLPELSLPLIKLDEEKINIVLSNLVYNAIKYTMPGGSVSLKITKQNILSWWK